MKLQSHGIMVVGVGSLFPIAETNWMEIRAGHERPVLFYKVSAPLLGLESYCIPAPNKNSF